MQEFDIVQDQLEYVGLLAVPAFRLFATPAALASGLYHAFQGFHSGADAITFDGDVAQPLRQACAVDLGDHGSYKLSVERVEWTRPGAWAWELNSTLLAHGDAWLRSTRTAGALLHSHYFTYSAHARPLSGSVRDLLLSIGAPPLPGFGESDGTGLIFHTRTADGNYPVQLTVDHSHEVENGLYLELVVSIEQDLIEYGNIGSWLLGLLHHATANLRLSIVTGVG